MQLRTSKIDKFSVPITSYSRKYNLSKLKVISFLIKATKIPTCKWTKRKAPEILTGHFMSLSVKENSSEL
jgi:hypothetical protein